MLITMATCYDAASPATTPCAFRPSRQVSVESVRGETSACGGVEGGCQPEMKGVRTMRDSGSEHRENLRR